MMLNAPEGASYDFTDRFISKGVKFVMDSVPEANVILSLTAPPGGFGTGSVNNGFIRLVLNDPHERKRSQEPLLLDSITSALEADVPHHHVKSSRLSNAGFPLLDGAVNGANGASGKSVLNPLGHQIIGVRRLTS